MLDLPSSNGTFHPWPHTIRGAIHACVWYVYISNFRDEAEHLSTSCRCIQKYVQIRFTFSRSNTRFSSALFHTSIRKPACARRSKQISLEIIFAACTPVFFDSHLHINICNPLRRNCCANDLIVSIVCYQYNPRKFLFIFINMTSALKHTHTRRHWQKCMCEWDDDDRIQAGKFARNENWKVILAKHLNREIAICRINRKFPLENIIFAM